MTVCDDCKMKIMQELSSCVIHASDSGPAAMRLALRACLIILDISSEREINVMLTDMIISGGSANADLPLTEITLSSCPHLGQSQGSAQPKCNGRASPWGNRLGDHG